MVMPRYLLDSLTRHAREGRALALLVRHAERHPVVDLRTHADVLLTSRGHEQAVLAGRALAAHAPVLRLMHSPVERCAQTARALQQGAHAAGADAVVVGALPDLATPFLRDPERGFHIVMERGPRFMRDWFDGLLPSDVFEPKPSAARVQLDAVLRHLTPGALCVFVSHDWNIALVRDELLGVSPESAWPGFLDGIALACEDNEVILELDGKTERHTRPRASTC